MTTSRYEPGNSIGNRYLSERGIANATAQTHGVEIDQKPASERFLRRLGYDMLPDGKLTDVASTVIWFPCRDIKGMAISWIARPLPTIGKTKFLNPQGVAFPFIPSQTWLVASKPHKPLVITEGPVKALSVAQAGQLAIGVSGVWMATKKGTDGRIELVPFLREFEWTGRLIYLAFDADWRANPGVRQALIRTFLALFRQGAKVRFLCWPVSEGKGIDDYLLAKVGAGPATALTELIEGAREIGKLIEPEDLTIIENELSIAKLSKAQLSQLSRILADPLKVKASALEEDTLRNEVQTVDKSFELADPEPWLEPVAGAVLIEEIMALVRRHVIMSEHESIVTALWVLLTYVESYLDVLPILAITSPQKRCGKTTLLSILRRLVRRPLAVSSVTPAALFRSVEKWTPTLLIDEADTFLKDNEQLRGILNAGHARDLAYTLRTNPETLEPERFSTWAPKAIACIGKLPDTLIDRSVHLRLERRTCVESIAKLRDANTEVFERLPSQAMRWALDNGDKIRVARPPIPHVLNDRAGDNWFPLLAIAIVAGRDWYERVAMCAVTVNSSDDSGETLPIAVLSALRKIFRQGAGFLPTDEILRAVNEDKEAPWADWENGMTPEKLGRILKSFAVKSEQRQQDGERHRGYSLKALQPVFDRYLTPLLPPPNENGPQPVHSSANQVSEPIGNAQVQGTQPVHAQVLNFNTCSADPLPEPIGEEMHRFKPKPATRAVNGSFHSNSHEEDSDEETVLSPENGYGTRLPKKAPR